MEIITGYTGKPHVTAEQDRDINIGIFGKGSCVLQTGQQLNAVVISNNEIRITDGVLIHQGCAASIKKNTTNPVTIANGSQGMKRIDLIVARYTKNTRSKVEAIEIKVIQGTPSESNPAVPSYTSGDIQGGDLTADMPLYQVEINGLTIADVKRLFTVRRSAAEFDTEVDSVKSTLSNRETIFINTTAQGADSDAYKTATLDLSQLKAGITYAFALNVVSTINGEQYSQEVSCKLNEVDMGCNGNYYKLSSTFFGKCQNSDKMYVSAFKNGGSWTGVTIRGIFIPVD